MDEDRRTQFLAEYAVGDRCLLDMGEARETAAVRTVVDQMAGRASGRALWQRLGIANPHLSWWAFEIPTRRLLGDVLEAKKPGDVDLIVGSLELRASADEVSAMVRGDSRLAPFANSSVIWQLLADRGLLVWPPRVSHLAAVEARAGRWFADDTQHGIQSGRLDYAEKARGLVAMGFDEVVLLHLIGTEPVGGKGFGAWLAAGNQAEKAANFMEHPRQALDACADEAPFGGAHDAFSEVVWPLGSVPNRSEFLAGSGVPRVLRHGVKVPATSRAQELRANINSFLGERLGKIAPPTFAPVFVHRRASKGSGLVAHHSVFGPAVAQHAPTGDPGPTRL